MPAAWAGTIQSSASHQLEHEPSFTLSRASGSQSLKPNVFDTMRLPGARLLNDGNSFSMFVVSRKIAMTLAFEMSASYMSPCTNVARSPTPASVASFVESATMSGLYSTPTPRAPRLAAAMMLRPSPEPISMTKSSFVTLAMSSISSTRLGGVGTQTTSLPG